MNKTERQNHIIQLIEQSPEKHLIETRHLAEQFGVSEMTVRRDFQELSYKGLVKRQHGGVSQSATAVLKEKREIGVLLAFIKGKYSDPFFNAVLEGVDHKLQELGCRLAYIKPHNELNTAAQARDLLKANPTDGIIFLGPLPKADSMAYLKENLHALVATTESISSEYDTITFDGYHGIRDIVDHLVQSGYRRLGFITGHHDFRRKAFLDGVKAHALPSEAELCVTVPFGDDGWTPKLGHLGAEHLLKLSKPPDAIVCASDLIAIGAIQWLHQHNIRVPNDIAVTGFDDIPESAFTTPALTSVHVHKHLIGELAVERVVKRIEDPAVIALRIQTPTHLVIRQSSEGNPL
ncbi:MAG: substrate-binding domain-containing protein [Chloroflexi bacterium]|nr:substrate-binding domain-containing protein [Chloroflexota bacterium]